MKNITTSTKAILLFTFLGLLSFSSNAQGHNAHSEHELGLDFWFGLLELPFLVVCVVYAFLTSNQMKDGKFGSGMNLLAWGFIVMAIGHMHMQIDHFFGVNIFNNIFGDSLGSIIWVTALIVTWTLSAIGFVRIYRASKA